LRQIKHYLGMNKMGHHASVCLIHEKSPLSSAEILIKERFTRLKTADGPVDQLLRKLTPNFNLNASLLCENTFGFTPLKYETKANKKFPYFETLKKTGLGPFTAYYNPELRFATHHFCHAMAATAVSPFKKSIVIVLDGSGNVDEVFPKNHPEILKFPPPLVKRRNRSDPGSVSESCTVYLQNGSDLECVHKEWQLYTRKSPKIKGVTLPWFSSGLGMFYQTIAYYIFANSFESGKVMGLAPFGKPLPVKNRVDFCANLDWEKSFRGRGKAEWEASPDRNHFADIAASAQAHFEETILGLVSRLKERHPEFENLILTGGCALNCTTNMKIVETKKFKNVFVPPFPSDECISFGAANHLRCNIAKKTWSPWPMKKQRGNFGPVSSIPSAKQIKSAFAGHAVSRSSAAARDAARLLMEGKLIGWFQGRSESGPRALGNRSILADPRIRGLKDLLNTHVKFREGFRPYACSIPYERVRNYFEVEAGFESPFMSFAPKIRTRYRKILKEVSHVDGTSRVQTVRAQQNPRFYELLVEFDRLTNLPCVLNTSMNVMGEPIVESVEDAARFFRLSNIDAMVIEDFVIERKLL
jgi:carbamoyltransferase